MTGATDHPTSRAPKFKQQEVSFRHYNDVGLQTLVNIGVSRRPPKNTA